MNRLHHHLGEAIAATGIAHILVGIATNRTQFAGLVRDGLINTVPDRGDRNEALWFTTNGALLVAAGLLARDHIRRARTLPRPFGAVLLATGLAAAAVQPKSGAWLVGTGGLLALRRPHPAPPAPPA